MAEKDKPQNKNNDNSKETNANKQSFPNEKQAEQIKKLIKSRKFENEEEIKQFIDEALKNEPELDLDETDTPLEKAQRLIFEAWDAPTRKECIALARQALKISPDCADAYVILAEEYATSLGEAIYYYRAGVAAGERAIGAKLFKKLTGRFWANFKTRPYMRARAGLAECLWEMGKQAEAIAHYRDMLKLNPGDNQGIRFSLASCLLKIGDWEGLKKLLARYHDGSAAWLYTRALVTFVEQGDSTEARRALAMAVKYNPNVIPYLTGRKKLPRALPEFIGYGDRNEAVYYVADFGAGWEETPGAIEWLSKVYPQPPRSSAGKKVKGIPRVFLDAFEND
jgi:tetratricopeptide (TPR) repeat protein